MASERKFAFACALSDRVGGGSISVGGDIAKRFAHVPRSPIVEGSR